MRFRNVTRAHFSSDGNLVSPPVEIFWVLISYLSIKVIKWLSSPLSWQYLLHSLLLKAAQRILFSLYHFISQIHSMDLELGQRCPPLEKEMATHYSILACKIPWTEEHDGLSPWGRKESGMLRRCPHPHFKIQLDSVWKRWVISLSKVILGL